MPTGYEVKLYADVTRIADALDRIASLTGLPPGCTGHRDRHGRITHDGDTCPVHEDAVMVPRAELTAVQTRLDEVAQLIEGTPPDELVARIRQHLNEGT